MGGGVFTYTMSVLSTEFMNITGKHSINYLFLLQIQQLINMYTRFPAFQANTIPWYFQYIISLIFP